MFKLDLEKAEEPEIKFPTSPGSLKKQESSRKTSTFAVAQTVKHLPAGRETQVRSLGLEDPLEKEMAIQLYYSCLEDSMDRGAWWAIVRGVAKNQT